MAQRPIFVPLVNGKGFVLEHYVNFEWHSGFAKSQKQKSIRELHEMAFKTYQVHNPLEVSSKSEDELGVALSSFNLKFRTQKGRVLTVEAAFQGSKVFESGGPFTDIFSKSPMDAKRDERLKTSGKLVKFSFFGEDWPLIPLTAFYDWLYIRALLKNPNLARLVTDFDGFTDIEFNPERSINCQARAVALYCALYHADKLEDALKSQSSFIALYRGRVSDPHRPEEVRYLI
ncbi:DarT1-associated NADAR antitoxin family protein [Sphingomonas sp. MS122]|uniref:DarT1-associated NADAR antitoxin family protein n=1 Tax=Sphingomonas sp. MS122 TaxID=3412683 RepID=UPI003C2D350D